MSKAALKHMPRAMVAAIEAHRIAHLKMAHKFAQIGPGGVYQQMKMVAHQNIAQQIDMIYFAAVGQRFQEDVAILGQKNMFL